MLAMPTRRRRAAARSAASACAIVSAIALVVVACLQFSSHGTEDASVMQDTSMNAPAGRHLMGSALPSEDVAAAGVPPANTTCTPASGRAKFGSTSFWINAGVSLGTAWCVYACARCVCAVCKHLTCPLGLRACADCWHSRWLDHGLCKCARFVLCELSVLIRGLQPGITEPDGAQDPGRHR